MSSDNKKIQIIMEDLTIEIDQLEIKDLVEIDH